MNGKHELRFRAGPSAYRSIKSDGFDPKNIGTIAGASGGAKWLVLSQLDRVIIDRILPKLTSRSLDVLTELLGPTGVHEIINNPLLRTHVMTVRSGSLAATEKKATLAAALVLAAAANVVSRRSLGRFFRRSLFYDSRTLPPFFDAVGFPYDRVRLSQDNYVSAVLASGAIPLVLRGVKNIPGAPPGVYRDGGIIDYHLDFQTSDSKRLTLYPHFYDHLIPGWFDKRLHWRRNQSKHIDRTLLMCPSNEFVSSLPNGKIPDRTDFQSMEPVRRRKVWREVISACRRLADELNDVLERGDMPARLEAL